MMVAGSLLELLLNTYIGGWQLSEKLVVLG